MSFSEVQKAIDGLSPGEQDRLAAYLTALRLRRDPAHLQELDRRLEDKEPAQWLTLNEVKEKLKGC